ncbi:MAG: cytochrome P460 family protein [Chloroflexota bacterium]
MLSKYFALIAVVTAFVGGLLFVGRSMPQTEAAPDAVYAPSFDLPDYRNELVHYTTVDRPDSRSRDIYISPGAAERVATNSTARLPGGTVIVIEAHSTFAGQRRDITEVHVAVKRDNWELADYATAERAGAWNFFVFDPETLEVQTDGVFDCFDCHANNSHIDFIFSRNDLIAYGQTGEVQESFCNRTRRLPCRF